MKNTMSYKLLKGKLIASVKGKLIAPGVWSAYVPKELTECDHLELLICPTDAPTTTEPEVSK